MQLPDIKDTQKLHKKYAPSHEVFNLVWEHSCIVRDIALQLINKNKVSVDINLVIAGALLHDIGVYPLFGKDGKLRPGINYITHGIEGEAILQAERLPEFICRFASHHTGIGLSKEDIISQNLPLPPADYQPETEEELLILYADKFHSKTNPPLFNSFAYYKNYVARFGKDKPAKFELLAVKFGIPELEELSKKYGYDIR